MYSDHNRRQSNSSFRSMASTSGFLFFVVTALCSLSASGRPCKTIFFITNSFPKPSSNNSPHRLTFLVTEIRRTRSSLLPRPMLLDHGSITTSSSNEPSYYSTTSSIKTSIRERTMDMMSIVGAVLFGVGCGALTAGTMYLFWSLFAPRRFDFGSDDSDDDIEEEEENKKDCASSVVGGSKSVPPSADEVDAMMK